MKFFQNLNHNNEKNNIQTENFIENQLNLVKMSNGDPRVLNEKYECKSENEMK